MGELLLQAVLLCFFLPPQTVIYSLKKVLPFKNRHHLGMVSVSRRTESNKSRFSFM